MRTASLLNKRYFSIFQEDQLFAQFLLADLSCKIKQADSIRVEQQIRKDAFI